MGTAKFRNVNQRKAEKMGLNYYKRFGGRRGDRFFVDQIWSRKQEALAHARKVRKSGRKARIVVRKVKWPGEKRATKTYVVYASRTQKIPRR